MNDKIIGYIENGIVIDHISLGKVFEIASLLDLGTQEGRVSLGEGYESGKIGKKGILKVEGMVLSNYEINLIALIAEHASVSIIKEGKIADKYRTEIPNVLKGIVLCPNLACISNDVNQMVISLINFKDNLFKCHYCSKEFRKDELRLRKI
ncbi:MAG: aspartate carbamoyltransferase regulatory subunit [archaeon]